MKQKRTLQDLTLKNNFMFGAVMTDEENCRQFLEIALGFPIAKVTVSKEQSLIYHPEYRGVRLDVYARDENNTRYNVEMQVAKHPNLPKRARYYHSQIDMELLLKGEDYSNLPYTYVIFICDFDPFGQKRYCYHFFNCCKEDKALALKEGCHTIFLSTCGENDHEVPKSMVKFLKFVHAGLEESQQDFDDEFVKRLQESVQRIRQSREMEERYMLFEELLRDERAAGRAEGKAEGKAEALLLLLENLGEVPEAVRENILAETDSYRISAMLKQAVQVKSVEEFLIKFDYNQ